MNCELRQDFFAAILICGDRCRSRIQSDRTAPLLRARSIEMGVAGVHTEIVPDDNSSIKLSLEKWTRGGVALVLTSGGIGGTPENHDAVGPALHHERLLISGGKPD